MVDGESCFDTVLKGYLSILAGLKMTKGGNMGDYRVYLKVTVELLAQISGRCEATVRRHIKKGVFDPTDWQSINKWVPKCRKGSG